MQAYRLAVLSAIVLYGTAVAVPVRDLSGKPVDPTSEGVAVLLFTRSDCPISNRYAPEINRLHDRFRSQGVRFWLIYVDPRQTPEAVQAHGREYGYTMSAVVDREHELVRMSGAKFTPEAVVYAGGRIVYRGRIDDTWTSFGKARASASVRDVEDVLTDAVASKRAKFRSTKPVGCFIEDLR